MLTLSALLGDAIWDSALTTHLQQTLVTQIQTTGAENATKCSVGDTLNARMEPAMTDFAMTQTSGLFYLYQSLVQCFLLSRYLALSLYARGTENAARLHLVSNPTGAKALLSPAKGCSMEERHADEDNSYQ